jgi:hypothetical protein
VAPKPESTCGATTPNLVSNPSFEVVNGGAWEVRETTSTQVPQWTRTDASLPPPYVRDNASSSAAVPAADGTKLLINAWENQGFVGELWTPAHAGTTYVMSAKVAFSSTSSTNTGIEMWLRDSATGAVSAPVMNSVLPAPNWVSISGTVTPSGQYDRIVLRHTAPQYGGWGYVDDVHLCAAQTAKESCAPSASNLVQNPGFEQVNPGSGPMWSIKETATTEVANWTRTTPAALYVPAAFGSGYFGGYTTTASEGSKYAKVGRTQGIVGVLSATPVVGTAYLLTARVASWEQASGPTAAGTFELRLRNDASAAESDPILQTSIIDTDQWVLIAAPVTPNGNYDRVIVRYSRFGASNSSGLIDDMHLCLAAATAPLHPVGWWTTLPVIGIAAGVTALILGGLGLWWWRKHSYKLSHILSN